MILFCVTTYSFWNAIKHVIDSTFCFPKVHAILKALPAHLQQLQEKKDKEKEKEKEKEKDKEEKPN